MRCFWRAFGRRTHTLTRTHTESALITNTETSRDVSVSRFFWKLRGNAETLLSVEKLRIDPTGGMHYGYYRPILPCTEPWPGDTETLSNTKAAALPPCLLPVP